MASTTVAAAAAAASSAVASTLTALSREQRRTLQEYRWKEAEIDGREQLHFREAAIVHRDKFKCGINRFRTLMFLVELTFDEESWMYNLPGEICTLIVEFVCGPKQAVNFASLHDTLETHGLDQKMEENETRKFEVLSRCRPLSASERERGDYECVTEFGNKKNLAVHDGKLHRSGNQVEFTHNVFRLSQTFSQSATNDDLRRAFRPYLDAALTRYGADSPTTFIFYGQTGTGKTFSMGAVLAETSEKLALCWKDGGTCLHISAFELLGKNACHDMFANRKKLKVLNDREGRAHVRGAAKIKFESRPQFEELAKVFEVVMRARTSIETQENARSSRSHLIIELRLENAEGEESLITLVDLAGSEMNYETVKHDRLLHRQAADINLALMSLRRCFQSYYHIERGMTKVKTSVLLPLDQRRKVKRGGKNSVTVSSSVRTPFRSCMLTRLLRECFVREKAATVLLCCFSPASSSVTHTINALDSLQLMKTHLPKATFSDTVAMREADHIKLKPVHEWTTEDVKDWVVSAKGGKFSHIVLPPNVCGADLVKLSANRFARLFESENLREARGEMEGRAWAIGAEQLDVDAPGSRLSEHYDLGRELWSALREHQRDYFDSTLLGR